MLTGKLWHSGDFSIGLRGNDKSEDCNDDVTDLEPVEKYLERRIDGRIEGITYFQMDASPEVVRDSSIRQAHRIRGESGLTSYGRKMVRNGAMLLEERWGKECLTFGTATVPALEGDEWVLINFFWYELTRQFFQELTRLLKRKGLSQQYIQVTEIQTKRFEERGELAPHLHWVMQGKRHSQEHWRITPIEITNLWERLLCNLVGRKLDCKAATRIEPIRKSAANYLAKYMSKGLSMDRIPDSFRKLGAFPHAWYGVSKILRSRIQSSITKLDNKKASLLIDLLQKFPNQMGVWFREIRIAFEPNNPDSKTWVAGYYGRITDLSILELLRDSS